MPSSSSAKDDMETGAAVVDKDVRLDIRNDDEVHSSPYSAVVEPDNNGIIEDWLNETPTIEIVEIHRIKSWLNFNVFVIEFCLPSLGYRWRIHTRSRNLLKLHLVLQNVKHLGMFFQFPVRLMKQSRTLEGIQEKPLVENYLRNLLENAEIRKHPKTIEFLQLSTLRFSKKYGQSITEGWGRMHSTLLIRSTEKSVTNCLGFALDRKTIVRLYWTLWWTGILTLAILGPLTQASELTQQIFGVDQEGEDAEFFLVYVSLSLAFLSIAVLLMLCVIRYIYRRNYWVVIKPTVILFFRHWKDVSPAEVFFIDDSALDVVKSKLLQNGSRFMSEGFHISNSTQYLEYDCQNKLSRVAFEHSLLLVKKHLKVQNHRFDSFAPMRPAVGRHCVSNTVQHLVDGEEILSVMLQKLQNATREVFIAGWWISPEYYLKRPASEFPESALAAVLESLASRGVQVYVLLFKESPLVLPNDSHHTKTQLRSLHRNIHIIRHPTFLLIPAYWSHHEKIVVIDQHEAFVGGLDICLGRYDNPSHPITDEEERIFPGKDYSNPRVKDFVDVSNPWVDMIDRNEVSRMPWHDVSCLLTGPVAADVAKHFVLRWNFTVKKKYSVWYSPNLPESTPLLMPRDISSFDNDMSKQEDTTTAAVLPPLEQVVNEKNKFTAGGIPPFPAKVFSKWKNKSDNENAAVCHCQIVRSVSSWSGGVLDTESSIQKAYVDLISKSKHFIYIENQFFVSGFNGDSAVSNRIVQALFDRISRAHQEKEVFRVMIVLPLLPAFEGAVTSKDASSLRAVMHWQYQCISRGGNSLLEKLSNIVPNPKDYVMFYGLRNYGRIGERKRLATEQIYIHSKLMIVDDRVTIIGSANINDRSLRGDRDSEIAIVIEDSEFQFEEFNGIRSSVGKFSHNLRLRLLAEHLDESNKSEVKDFVSDRVWIHKLQAVARVNTALYQSTFQCLPSDAVLGSSTSKEDDNGIESTMLHDDSTVFVFENQRFMWGHGWKKENLLPSDVAPLTRADGQPVADFTPGDGWSIDLINNKNDRDGWAYGICFDKKPILLSQQKSSSSSKLNKWVRSRCWSSRNSNVENENSNTFPKVHALLQRSSTSLEDVEDDFVMVHKSNSTDDDDTTTDDDHANAEAALNRIQGHLVEFPLNFLQDVNLRPPVLPKSIFT